MRNHIRGKSSRLMTLAFLGVLLTSTLAGCSTAAFGKPSLAIEVQSAVSSGNVNVQLIDGTALLTGRVLSAYDSNAAARAASRYEGVEKVDNQIYVVH